MMNETFQPEPGSRLEVVSGYADGAALILANAEALYEEARLLGVAGHFARATVLHQISMEECSKIEMLGAAAISILTGYNVDENRLSRAFRNHKVKNRNNSYFKEPTNEEEAARARRDWKAAHEAFINFQKKFHDDVNAIKNAGLYVDFQDGQFTAPVDQVDESTAIAFQGENAELLKISDHFLWLLRKIVRAPDFNMEFSNNLVDLLKNLYAPEESNPEQALEVLLEALRVNHLTGKDGKELNDIS